MGDSGALLLGFTLASVSVQGLLEDRRPRDARLAAARARGAADRHLVRRRQAHQARPAGLLRRPLLTSTTASRTSASRSAAPSSTSTSGARRSRSPRSRRASSIRTATAGTRRASRSTPRSELLAIGVLGLRHLPARDREARRIRSSAAAKSRPAPKRRASPHRQERRRRAAHQVARYKLVPKGASLRRRLRCHELAATPAACCDMLRADGARRAACRSPRSRRALFSSAFTLLVVGAGRRSSAGSPARSRPG